MKINDEFVIFPGESLIEISQFNNIDTNDHGDLLLKEALLIYKGIWLKQINTQICNFN